MLLYTLKYTRNRAQKIFSKVEKSRGYVGKVPSILMVREESRDKEPETNSAVCVETSAGFQMGVIVFQS